MRLKWGGFNELSPEEDPPHYLFIFLDFCFSLFTSDWSLVPFSGAYKN